MERDEGPEPPEEQGDDEGQHTALPPRVENWRRRSATGALLTGIALGIQEALEVKRDDPAIVVQTSGDPPQDLPVEAELESGRPRHSVVNIRPWLLDRPQTTSGDQEGSGGASDESVGEEQSRPGGGGEAG